ncbi:putative F-box protein At3g25750 [Mercurialis annua]|uniref:putative F-box protein At3g25750 n=1 Tax=Mercurialis annua TaxID=3986 RepID=UPI00215E8F66|nr:putative F-box protein At3g25750 [Mercurialis annua]
MEKTVSSWSDLDSDLLPEIADRISCLRDFIIFGAVCKSWRSVASREKFKKSKVPWLLMEDRDEDDYSLRKFFDLSKDVIYGINLPELCDNKYSLSSHGWFLTVETDVRFSRVSLLNPFSLARIDLPRPFAPQVINFALSSSPSVVSDFTIMIVYFSPGMGLTKLGFLKNGDRKWTDVDLELNTFKGSITHRDVSITYYNGRFYIAQIVYSLQGFVVHEIDIQNSKSVSTSRKLFTDSFTRVRNHPFWIVESSGVLMMVTWRQDYVWRNSRGTVIGTIYSHATHCEFIVEEINFEKGECKKVTNLGDAAFFLGRFSSFSVDVSNYSRFKSNHIYFIENFQDIWTDWRGAGVGVYNMIDRSTKSFFSKGDRGYRSSYQWIQPRL